MTGRRAQWERARPALRVSGPGDFQQLSAELWSTGSRQPERRGEGARRVLSSWAVRIQAVVGKPSNIDDRALSIRQPHGKTTGPLCREQDRPVDRDGLGSSLCDAPGTRQGEAGSHPSASGACSAPTDISPTKPFRAGRLRSPSEPTSRTTHSTATPNAESYGSLNVVGSASHTLSSLRLRRASSVRHRYGTGI